MRRVGAWVVGLGIVLAAGAAWADGVVSQVRVGVSDHDTHLFNGVERGVDFNGEVLFATPVPEAWRQSLPWWSRWIAAPRPMIGGDINSAGQTSQGYLGLTWTPVRVGSVFRAGDALTLDAGFAPAFNDGYTSSAPAKRKALGSNLLFRTSIDLGYEISPRWAVYVSYWHASNAGLSEHNPGINDIGLRVGFHF